MEATRRFYVYEWFNVDTGEVFYVGKGTRSRWKDVKSRNQYFKNYYNKYNCDVRKVKQDLAEDESLDLEVKLIREYKNKGQCKCNLTVGGEGVTFEEFSEEWYRCKFRFFENTNHLGKYAQALQEAFDDCGVDESSLNLTYNEMKEIWNRYLELKEEQREYLENQATLYEMWENDPCFKDVWEGIC